MVQFFPLLSIISSSETFPTYSFLVQRRLGISPATGSGTPTTQQSLTAGCSYRTSSSSLSLKSSKTLSYKGIEPLRNSNSQFREKFSPTRIETPLIIFSYNCLSICHPYIFMKCNTDMT